MAGKKSEGSEALGALPSRSPPEEVLSGKSVQLQILSEALQHPTTLYPFAGSVVTALYAFFFGPFFGGGAEALLVALGVGAVSFGSFFWRYFIQGEDSARKKVQAMIAERERGQRVSARAELEQICRELEAGFRGIRSAQGLKELRELVHEYQELEAVMGSQDESDFVLLAQIASTARETYRQGLHILSYAHDLMRVVQTTDRKSLEEEIADLERQIRSLRTQADAEQRIKIKETTLASHRQRLALLANQEQRLEQLFGQSDLCEAALQRVRVELPTLKAAAGLSEERVGKVTTELIATIESAKRMQQMLSGDAYREEDTAYLKLGAQKERG